MDMNYVALDCIKINKKLYRPWEEKGFVNLMETPWDVKWSIESRSQNFGVVFDLKKQQ